MSPTEGGSGRQKNDEARRSAVTQERAPPKKACLSLFATYRAANAVSGSGVITCRPPQVPSGRPTGTASAGSPA